MLSPPPDAVLIPESELLDRLGAKLRGAGLSNGEAECCARLMVHANRDGNFTHGVELLPWLLDRIRDGVIVPGVTPTKISGHGSFERWDGRLGLGPVNAQRAMGRAIELAKGHGVGCVALRRTNHWFRAGSYGWQAVEAGVIGICWTNTVPLMPLWRGDRKLLGNNPLVLAVPTTDSGLVLDMAMSQFSIGALRRHAREGRRLPVPGGTDAQGTSTDDPQAILDGGLPLPMGLWKGAGLAMLLDVLAATLSDGAASVEMIDDAVEHGVSQVFLCIEPGDANLSLRSDAIVAAIRAVVGDARFPGDAALASRRAAALHGVPVRRDLWAML